MSPLHSVQVRWLTPIEGGRGTPFAGGRYTPTARFAGEQEQFSVVMEFTPAGPTNPSAGTMRLLNPELLEIKKRIVPGVALEIMEGSRVVAQCNVQG